jgi:hypothetical protein
MLVVVVLAVGVACLTWYGTGGQSPFAPRFSGPFIQPRATNDSARRDVEVDRRMLVLLSRGPAKDWAVRELLAGRLTLRQAAARFRAIEWEQPVTWGSPPRTEDGQGDDERLCRDIMARAQGWVVENLPEAATLVAARLEAELAQLRGPDGVVRLPNE